MKLNKLTVQLLLLLSFLGISHSTFADIFYDAYQYGSAANKKKYKWNGKKIYLSPARHTDAGRRGECKSLDGNENTRALRTALAAGQSLSARGYKVRIGTGTLSSAIHNSNAWRANIHIPIHSNARRESCNTTAANRHGAVLIYWSNSGKGLSNQILNMYKGVTPGTHDFVCHNSSPCTSIKRLAELVRTRGVAAYLEREFHSWDRGALFLNRSSNHSWRLASGVDKYLGYPRRRR